MAQVLRVTDPRITGTSLAGDLGGGLANVLDSAYNKKKYEAHEKQRNERLKVVDEMRDLRLRTGEFDLQQAQEDSDREKSKEAGTEKLNALDPDMLNAAITEDRLNASGVEKGGPLVSQMMGLTGITGKAKSTDEGKAFAALRSAYSEEDRKIKLARDIAQQGQDESGEYMTLDEGQHASLNTAAKGLFKVGGRYKTSEVADQLREDKKPGAIKTGWQKPQYNKETQSWFQYNENTGETRDAPGLAGADDGQNVLGKNFGRTEGGVALEGQALFDKIKANDYSTASKLQGLLDGSFDPKSLETMRGSRRANLFALMKRIEGRDGIPAFNQMDYATRFNTRNEFIRGKAGANIRSLNTAMGHAGDAIKLGEKLNNTMLTDWNKLKNNLISRTGYTQVTNFDKAIDALVAEAATLFKGTAGTDQEIKEWRRNFNSSQSPEQIQEGIETLMHLFKSRMDALGNQYAQGMGSEMQSDELLSEKNRLLFNKYAPVEDQLADPRGDSSIPYEQDFEQLARDEERQVVDGMQVQMEGQNRGIVDPNMMSEGLGGPQSAAPEVQWERGPDGRPRAVTPRI